MSRIHEALKKAEQQRVAGQGALPSGVIPLSTGDEARLLKDRMFLWSRHPVTVQRPVFLVLSVWMYCWHDARNVSGNRNLGPCCS